MERVARGDDVDRLREPRREERGDPALRLGLPGAAEVGAEKARPGQALARVRVRACEIDRGGSGDREQRRDGEHERPLRPAPAAGAGRGQN